MRDRPFHRRSPIRKKMPGIIAACWARVRHPRQGNVATAQHSQARGAPSSAVATSAISRKDSRAPPGSVAAS